MKCLGKCLGMCLGTFPPREAREAEQAPSSSRSHTGSDGLEGSVCRQMSPVPSESA